ncbi:MAG TPA: hypothetical protein DCE65_04955 [Clostridiales bacterium]|nr:hypothetical protein [Clostridiales bacterium]
MYLPLMIFCSFFRGSFLFPQRFTGRKIFFFCFFLCDIIYTVYKKRAPLSSVFRIREGGGERSGKEAAGSGGKGSERRKSKNGGKGA